MLTAVFDTKPYDRGPLQEASANRQIRWQFFEVRLTADMQDDELARLLTFPNVIITSHQAFLTREALADIARTTVANLEALATGAPYVENSLLT